MVLYKYVDAWRAKTILEKRRIRFTQPAGFNDPFEARPCFDSAIEEELIQQVCFVQDPDDPEHVSEVTRFRDHMRELWSRDDVKDWYASGTLRNIAVLCLTEHADSLLMWAHYGDCHKGAVIGFDPEHPSLAVRADGEPRRFKRVSYSKERPRRETLTDLSAEEMFFTKSPDWQYEGEWRVFDSTANAVETVPGQVPICLFAVDPSAVVEVILGAHIASDSAKALYEVLQLPEYRHTSVRAAELDRYLYRVNISDSEAVLRTRFTDREDPTSRSTQLPIV